jgi:hypothetical protein
VDAHLGWGWHEPEDWGVWTDGTSASLELGRWPGGPLVLEGHAFAPREPARVGWSLDGDEPLGLHHCAHLEPVALELDIPAGTRRVHLHLPDALSPLAAGLAPDGREISFGLCALRGPGQAPRPLGR